ncbi:hypothetical protein [Natronorubrum sp. DTA7]|uniref:hypothetical protein n=1 Tax=Natronorubrum sp. DTA7 TaxID=3447016 RepID=UPI003F862148
MLNTIKKVLFRKPDGRERGLALLSLAVVLIGYYIYQVRVHSFYIQPALIIGIAFAIFALSESLPEDKQKLAGVIRIVVILGAIVCIILI